MIWQRISARRAAALHSDTGPAGPRIPMMRRESQSRPGCVPQMVVREPEASWWRAQADLDQVAPAGPTTTVAILHEQDAGTEAAVTRLAELAVADELLVVFGSASATRRLDRHAMITRLRDRLPRHDVVPVHVGHHGTGRRWQAALDRFLEAGRLPVVVTASACLQEVTAEVSSYVRADRVLRVFGTTTRAELHQVWRRAEPSIN